MIVLLLYLYWSLWNIQQFDERAKSLFAFLSTIELGAELTVLTVFLITLLGSKKGWF